MGGNMVRRLLQKDRECVVYGSHPDVVQELQELGAIGAGYCLMIGGETNVVKHLAPIFAVLAPGVGDIPVTPGRYSHSSPERTAEQDYLHCGPHGESRWFTTPSNTGSWPPMPKD